MTLDKEDQTERRAVPDADEAPDFGSQRNRVGGSQLREMLKDVAGEFPQQVGVQHLGPQRRAECMTPPQGGKGTCDFPFNYANCIPAISVACVGT